MTINMLKKKIRHFFGLLIIYHLKLIAKISLFINHPIIIGVAGSIGKSSTCYAIEAVLKNEMAFLHIHTNSETGVPLGILGLEKGDYTTKFWLQVLFLSPFKILYLKHFKVVLIEMGVDSPKDMSYLLSIVQPEIGIITHESATHTQQFSQLLSCKERKLPKNDQEKILIQALTKEDYRLVNQKKCRFVLFNTDNIYLKKQFQLHPLNKKQVWRLGSSKNNQLIFLNYRINDTTTIFEYKIKINNIITDVILKFHDHALPKEYQTIFGFAILTGLIFNLPIKKIITNLENQIHLPKSRSTLIYGKNSRLIIDSSYNSSKESVLSLLNLVLDLKLLQPRPVIIVLADMLELGPLSQKEHFEVGRVALNLADQLILVGDLTKQYILPLATTTKIKIKHFENLKLLRDYLPLLPKNSLILFKGSQGQLWLEEAIKILIQPHQYDQLCRQNIFWQKVKKKKNLWF